MAPCFVLYVCTRGLLGVCSLGGGDLSGLLTRSGGDRLVVRLSTGLVGSGLIGSRRLDDSSLVGSGLDLGGVSGLLNGSLEELLLPVGERLSVTRVGVVLLLQALCGGRSLLVRCR